VRNNSCHGVNFGGVKYLLSLENTRIASILLQFFPVLQETSFAFDSLDIASR
jgi:hypothetical protein